MTRYSPVLQDATYSCQCPTGNGFVECNSTLSSRSVEVFAPSSSAPIEPTRIVGIDEENLSRSTPISHVASTEDISQSISPQSQSVEVGTTGETAEFPMHSLGPQIQHVIGTRPDQSSTPQFPLTSLGSTHSVETVPPTLPIGTTMRILPRPTQKPTSNELSTAEFTRLPASSLQPTTPAAIHVSTEEFERLTHVVEASTEAVGTDHVGPKHSMEGTTDGDDSGRF